MQCVLRSYYLINFLIETPSVSSVQSLSHVQLFATPWTAVRQASLSINNSQSLLKLMSIDSVMPSNHLIHCHPLLLPPSIFPSIRVFFNELVLRIEEGSGNPLQYSCLKNPIDRGAWKAAVHGVAKSQTQLSNFTRKWQPTPVFLLGESQGWRSLVGCRLWGCTESETTNVT